MTTLPTPEVARRLNVDTSTVHQWARENPDFPAPEMDLGYVKLWSFPAICRWLGDHKLQKRERAKARAREHPTVKGRTHGTVSCYRAGCRCPECTEGQRRRIQAQRERRRQKT